MKKKIHTLDELNKISKKQIRAYYGGKALGLLEAKELSLNIPKTYLISSEHYDAFLKKEAKADHSTFKANAEIFIQDLLGKELDNLPEAIFSVRSSSQNEDSSEHSFAGIFETKLDVPRKDLSKAIAFVWDSCFSMKVSSYVNKSSSLKMAVILQPMIEAKYSGVCFSKHPSPSSVFENQNIVIEFAPVKGEKIVQGEITPLRLSGTVDTLLLSVDLPWIDPLLKTVLALKTENRHEVDIEFVIDASETFWLMQQRPISMVHSSDLLDLTHYKRKYKRSLLSLDIELFIEGCSLYLAPYLEIPYQMDRWMLMTTDNAGVQELWGHEILDQAVIYKLSEKIGQDQSFLERIEERYAKNYHAIIEKDYNSFFDEITPLPNRFFLWCEFITPLSAHYYVPMFMIDSLHLLLKQHMAKIDAKNAEDDLFFLGTYQIASLMDLLNEELKNLKRCIETTAFEELKPSEVTEIEKLTEKYGFLNCHQIYEEGFSAKDLFEMMQQLIDLESEPQDEKFEQLISKYFASQKELDLFEKFREWMAIRNQKMEYLYYIYLKSRPLFEEISLKLGLSIKRICNSSKDAILHSLKQNDPSIVKNFKNEHLIIFRNYGKTRLMNHLLVQLPSSQTKSSLKGKTVYGQGKIKAKVKIAFKPKDLGNIPDSKESYVLVTGMTTPDFIPSLKKSFSALITDEGGILCHAAIVAREIPIPCIVGTGMATNLLKEGMEVMIDFDRGEIII